jgi:hypothetical protein
MASLRVLTPRILFGHPVEHVDPDALAIDAYDIACSHVYEVRLPEEGKRALIRTDDPLAPRAYVATGVLFVLTNCGVAVWSPTKGTASHGVPLPDSAVQTRHGILVIHQIGCIMFGHSGGISWEYRHDHLVDFHCGPETVMLAFDDGSKHEVDLGSGRRRSPASS